MAARNRPTGHEDAFALYYGTGPVDPNNANDTLIDLLTARLHAAP